MRFAEALRQREAKCPMGRQGTCWDVARAALFPASDDAAYVTGTLLMVDGGASIRPKPRSSCRRRLSL
ncbi:SDR family oxidoreductase [Bordetella genomosp. 11]|uniref:SDR family oxidoreductase n=1 Tax=Bordetella genomosp. 11 TaxID=1416808 RepID=UPI003F81CB79